MAYLCYKIDNWFTGGDDVNYFHFSDINKSGQVHYKDICYKENEYLAFQTNDKETVICDGVEEIMFLGKFHEKDYYSVKIFNEHDNETFFDLLITDGDKLIDKISYCEIYSDVNINDTTTKSRYIVVIDKDFYENGMVISDKTKILSFGNDEETVVLEGCDILLSADSRDISLGNMNAFQIFKTQNEEYFFLVGDEDITGDPSEVIYAISPDQYSKFKEELSNYGIDHLRFVGKDLKNGEIKFIFGDSETESSFKYLNRYTFC